jgi:hypothetical protein
LITPAGGKNATVEKLADYPTCFACKEPIEWPEQPVRATMPKDHHPPPADASVEPLPEPTSDFHERCVLPGWIAVHD